MGTLNVIVWTESTTEPVLAITLRDPALAKMAGVLKSEIFLNKNIRGRKTLMKRILIFGNSGSGKSTLARAYCSRFDLAHLDLDTLAWQPGSSPTRMPISESKRAIMKFTEANGRWVIEGCYSDLLSIVAVEANEAIFLNPGIEQCISNCRNRPWEPHKYASKQKQDENLNMLINWIKQYPERADEFSLESHRALYANFQGKKAEYLSNIDQTEAMAG